MSIHKKDIIKKVANKLNLTESDTTSVINTFIDTFILELIKEERIELRGFGVFQVKTRKPKNIRDISTGEIIQINEYKDIDYKTSKVIKKKLNSKPKRKLKRKTK